MSKFGIDVSHHNGKIDWGTVKNQIDFAILKLGNIGDGNKFWLDNCFETNYNECKNLGIPIGVYVYCYTNEIENIDDCAREVSDYMKDKELDLPIYIDMEDKEIAPEGKTKLTELVFTFNTIIEQSGFWAGVYANKNWFDNYLEKDKIRNRFTTWIAAYSSGTDRFSGEYDIWQNSSSGTINGINGKVDTNYMYRDLVAEIGNTNQSNSNTTIQKTVSVVDLAYEVIAGKYGDGDERKKALGALYNDVQAKVNEIMGINTTNKLSIEEVAKKVIAGDYDNGANRKAKLEAEGYNYTEVQSKVNELMKSSNTSTYIVKSGDTLSSIAKKYNTTISSIAHKNNIKDVNKIYANQVLKI